MAKWLVHKSSAITAALNGPIQFLRMSRTFRTEYSQLDTRDEMILFSDDSPTNQLPDWTIRGLVNSPTIQFTKKITFGSWNDWII